MVRRYNSEDKRTSVCVFTLHFFQCLANSIDVSWPQVNRTKLLALAVYILLSSSGKAFKIYLLLIILKQWMNGKVSYKNDLLFIMDNKWMELFTGSHTSLANLFEGHSYQSLVSRHIYCSREQHVKDMELLKKVGSGPFGGLCLLFSLIPPLHITKD